MNDGNIKHYLDCELAHLKSKIKNHEDGIEARLRQINDLEKELKNFKVHYTSLLNTAIAYGYEVEKDD